MIALFLTTLIYTISAAALTLVLHESWDQAASDLARIALTISKVVAGSEIKLLLLAVPLIWWLGHQRVASRLRVTIIVGAAAVLLQIGFFFVKSAIPRFVPFYADPFFAELDRMLLLGHDAWELAHWITPSALAAWLPALYSKVWSTLVFALPIIVAASDPDEHRMKRYIWLYFLSWVVTGNILALAGSSVGPVYYDLLLGTERYAAMRESFDLIGYSTGEMAVLQQWLWDNSGTRVSFISAFPSMHVAVTVVGALYLRERARWLWPVGDGFFVLILLTSIYSGYHYLVDGVASLVIVLALNAGLRRIFLEPARTTP